MRYEYYRDREVGFEGFTAKNYLFREEFTSRTWATRYDFPAFKDGRVKRDVLPDDTPSGAQGWFINTRRDKFKDRRLREALIDAFDFEWTNKNIMYGSYDRTHSVFQNSPMMATGKPSAAELALLEPFRGKLPDEVFGEPYVPPVTDGSGQDRRWLRHAAQLLNDAGLSRSRTASGSCRMDEPIDDRVPDRRADLPSRIICRTSKISSVLGIDATCASSIRCSTAPRGRFRFRHHDRALQLFGYAGRFAALLFFTRRRPRSKGSQNLAGIADPAVDALIDIIIAAKTRARADHRLPGASTASSVPGGIGSRTGTRRRTGSPIGMCSAARPAKPRYFRGIPDTWWYDRDKAAKIEKGG